MADVLREFLVAIGFRVDESSAKKAEEAAKRVEKTITDADKRRERGERDAAEAATSRSNAYVAGLGAMTVAAAYAATKISAAMVSMASGLEQVYYSSQRTKASADNIKAFSYAAGQLGSTAGAAVGSLEALAKNIRSAPGYEKMVGGLGVVTRKTNGEFEDLVVVTERIGAALAKMPSSQSIVWSEALGLDEATVNAMKSGDFMKHVKEYTDMLASAGLDTDKAAKNSADFMNIWRKMQSGLTIIATKIEGALVERFGSSIDKFTKWLVSNSGRISDGVIKIGETLLRLADRISDLFTAFDRLDPATKGFIIQLAAMGAALLLLKSGPLGILIALGTGFLALYDDYRKWKDGSTDTIIDWAKWEPIITSTLNALKSMGDMFDALSQKLLGQSGLTTAFEIFGGILLLKVLAPLTKVLAALGGISGTILPPWLMTMLGLSVAANANGILGTGEGSRSTGERVLRTLDPGAADRIYGKTESGAAADKADNRNLWQRYAPKALGGKDAPGSGQFTPRAAEAAGKYRPEYKLTEADQSQRLADIIAGEAQRKNPESIDAVINNMINRVGSKGWGPSGNLLQVAEAPGQYEASWKGSKANAKETEMIHERIRAIASGGVPDNTGGANTYRASWYTGRWAQKHAQDGRVVGGNRYAYEGQTPNGPYAPYGSSGAESSLSNDKQVAGGFHPLGGKGRFSSDYGMRNHPFGGRRPHNGIDLAAPAGTDVQAMQGGLVSIGRSGDVTIKQGDGSSTTYRHVVPTVADGARVAAGSLIAQLRANDPRSTGPHLHLEGRDADGNLIDPKSLLAPKPSGGAAAAIPRLEGALQNFDANMGKALGGKGMVMPSEGAPLGSTTNNTSGNVNHIRIDSPTTNTISGVGDAKQVGAEIGKTVSRTHADLLRNLQSAVA